MKYLFAALTCIIAALQLNASRLEGWWRADLVGLPIVLHITSAADNLYAGYLYSPAQTTDSIPIDRMTVDGDDISLDINLIGAGFKGRYLPGNQPAIAGTFMQGREFPLTFYPASQSDAQAYRPQTPRPPFLYFADDVEFKSGNLTMAGTLTYPWNGRPVGGVVLISGSGQQNRDEELYGHKPFAVIADYLSSRGWAVLRYDDRGVGGSSAGSSDDTTLDFATDAIAAIDFLRSQPMLKDRPVGLLGHSEGGTIALICAAEHPDSVDFVVSLAGMTMKGSETMIRQNEMISELSGNPLTGSRLENVKSAFRAIETEQNSARLKSTLDSLISTQIDDPSARRNMVDVMTSPWYVAFVRLDPANYMRRISAPVFAIGGSYDVQVDATQSLDALKQAIPSAKTKLYEGVNHLFQQSPNRASSMNYGAISQTISPEVLADIYRFLSEI